MTLPVSIAVALLGYALAVRRRVDGPMLVAGMVVATVFRPLVGGWLWLCWWALRRRSIAARRCLHELAVEREHAMLVHSMLIAISGGVSLSGALAGARESLMSGLGDAVDRLLRDSVAIGLAAALQAAVGSGARLFRQLGAAQATGAPVSLALGAYAHEIQEAERSRILQRARQLPVKMVVPLTLLMLLGFVLLTVGPTVLSSFDRLLGPFAGL